MWQAYVVQFLGALLRKLKGLSSINVVDMWLKLLTRFGLLVLADTALKWPFWCGQTHSILNCSIQSFTLDPLIPRFFLLLLGTAFNSTPYHLSLFLLTNQQV